MTGSLLVIAPHPDDEILGAGGIMAAARARGDAVAILILTDGARSDPGADPAELARLRRRESEAGLVALLDEVPPLLFIDQPDGAFSSTAVDMSVSALAEFLHDARPDTILVTDPADAHPDHKAAFGLATRLISAGCARTLKVMPVSQRVDRVFDAKSYQEQRVAPFEARKAAAMKCHSSQTGSGSGFRLSPQVLAAFNRSEYVRTAYDRDDRSQDATPAAHFDAMFEASSDPWGYDDEPYEHDRFGRTIDALAERRYFSALELGCANGALTEKLAPLCHRLLATDASSSALTVARKRVGHLADVSLVVASLPEDIPEGPFDLIVASDMLYYLGLDGVVASMAKLEKQAAAKCRMLIASYLGETETRLTGEMSSETAIAHLISWRRTRSERTDRLRIDVLDRS